MHQGARCFVLCVQGLFLSTLGMLGCSDQGPKGGAGDAVAAEPDGPWKSGIEIPAEKQKQGDPELGRTILLNGGYMGCGIPTKLLNNPLAKGTIGSAFGPTSGGQTIPGREGKNKDMPYGQNVFTTESGAEVVNVNCLMCHAGSFNGDLIVGLGTADADFTGGFGGGSGGIPAVSPAITSLLGLNAAETDQLNMMLTRSAVLGPETVMRTVGQNPAEAMAILLMTHHELDTLAWSDSEVIPFEVFDDDGELIEHPVMPSDPPPWWRAKKKHALFYNGMARGDHRGTMALATSLCVDDIEEAERIDEMFLHMQAYITTIEAPRYPFDIDDKLAEQGKVVFTRDCAGCHGTYGDSDEQDTYPNLLFPLDVIGTDPVVANGGVTHAPQMVKWYNKSFYGQITRMVVEDPFPGYMAPPLDGIWATGPFLHNGSVPTIELVLNSKARPKYWKRKDYDSAHFDETAVGWPFEATGSQTQAAADEKKHIYDSTQWGQAIKGHIFGDKLSTKERRAVLEYLKTL